MLYLASPYSGPEHIMQQRYEAVRRVTATFIHNKRWVYSPIVHCHEMAVRHKLPREFDFWCEYHRSAINHMAGICVLRLPGWTLSKGVAYEMEYARILRKPMYFVRVNCTAVMLYNSNGQNCGELVSEFTLIP